MSTVWWEGITQWQNQVSIQEALILLQHHRKGSQKSMFLCLYTSYTCTYLGQRSALDAFSSGAPSCFVRQGHLLFWSLPTGSTASSEILLSHPHPCPHQCQYQGSSIYQLSHFPHSGFLYVTQHDCRQVNKHRIFS